MNIKEEALTAYLKSEKELNKTKNIVLEQYLNDWKSKFERIQIDYNQSCYDIDGYKFDLLEEKKEDNIYYEYYLIPKHIPFKMDRTCYMWKIKNMVDLGRFFFMKDKHDEIFSL